ncbi:MAG TPA: DoxX family protein [Candidatus Krumholzibacteria bacterium]|nr:DoxX family protein [Candidatus Krumholzibacteria bacterium]
MLKRFFSSDEISVDFGLLLLRIGIGLSVVIFHGYDKLTGGPESWARIGANMANLHITWYPAFWGFMAGFAEGICSCLLILGLLFRPATLLLAFTMFVAAMHHLHLPEGAPNAGFRGAAHALELMSVYSCLFFTGPGKFSLTPRR